MRRSRCALAARYFESLEPRTVLSAAPAVTAVEVGGTAWDQTFENYLETNSLGQRNGLDDVGYAVGDGSSQTLPLPWNNIDTLTVWFDQDVVIDVNDLTLSGVTNTQHSPNGFWYDPQLQAATWTFAQPLSGDALLIDLNADGIDPITNRSGDTLDGEWTDSTSTFSSGDGLAGGDFEFSLNVLPGDVDRSLWVTYYDYFSTYYGSGLTTADPGYEPLYDVNGDGAVDSTDYLYVYSELGAGVPSGAPAGLTNEAPGADPHAYLEVQDRAVVHSIDLHALFDDPDGNDAALTFTIASNSSPALFDSVAIDSGAGELDIDAAASGVGRSNVVVTATDPGGLSSTVTIAIDVGRTNAPPEITHFSTTPTNAGTFVIWGYVTDSDDDPTGWIVTIAGALQTRAVLHDTSFGYRFLFEVVDDPNEYGSITATVSDPHGATDLAFADYGLS